MLMRTCWGAAIVITVAFGAGLEHGDCVRAGTSRVRGHGARGGRLLVLVLMAR
jgi:hypothetical protein